MKIIKINKDNPEKYKIKKVATILKKGGAVAFPTDTVYGIGADATNKKAVKKIYQIKKRNKNKPLVILVGRKSTAKKIVNFNAIAEKLTRRFWPGELTIIAKIKDKTLFHLAKNGAIGVRMPRNEIFIALAKSCDFLLATTSANLSGEPSATSAQDVKKKMDGKIDLIINGGETETNVASTVLDLSAKTPKIIRHGKITIKQIKKALSNNY